MASARARWAGLAFLGPGRLIERVPGQRIREPDLPPGSISPAAAAGAAASSPAPSWPRLATPAPIPGWLGRGDQQQQPGRRRQRRQPQPEHGPGSGPAGPPAGYPEPARQLGGRQPAGQLPQRSRVAPGLGHDPVPDLLAQQAGNGGLQQVRASPSASPPTRSSASPDRPLRPVRPPRPVTSGPPAAGAPRRPVDRRGGQVIRHEPQGLRRGPVQPLRIVHHAHQRPVPGHLAQQAQHAAGHETVRRTRSAG